MKKFRSYQHAFNNPNQYNLKQIEQLIKESTDTLELSQLERIKQALEDAKNKENHDTKL